MKIIFIEISMRAQHLPSTIDGRSGMLRLVSEAKLISNIYPDISMFMFFWKLYDIAYASSPYYKFYLLIYHKFDANCVLGRLPNFIKLGQR